MIAVFDQLVEATPAAPAQLRRALREWLEQLRWPAEGTDELVLAVNEAATNSVEHAYLDAEPGAERSLRVHAELATPQGELDGLRHIVVEVMDAGRWKPPPAGPGNRGRGLLMMRSVTRALEVKSGPAGTRVRMVSHPGHRAAPVALTKRIDQALHSQTAAWPGPTSGPASGRRARSSERATADD
jgi:anti-sigma regulatory factor (Ser/Thr protein kinase)